MEGLRIALFKLQCYFLVSGRMFHYIFDNLDDCFALVFSQSHLKEEARFPFTIPFYCTVARWYRLLKLAFTQKMRSLDQGKAQNYVVL